MYILKTYKNINNLKLTVQKDFCTEQVLKTFFFSTYIQRFCLNLSCINNYMNRIKTKLILPYRRYAPIGLVGIGLHTVC